MGKKETTKFIVQLIVSIASAILTALGAHSSNRYTLLIIYREINREPESQFAAF